MSCSANEAYLHLFLDNELDTQRTVEFEAHLLGCQSCTQSLGTYRTMKSRLSSDDLYFMPGASLERRVRLAVKAGQPAPAFKTAKPRAGMHGWVQAAAFTAALVAATAVVVHFGRSPSGSEVMAQEVLDSHIRSLMPGHLTDVESSDHHTVKPWFDGRLDFSPPVADLSGEGYPLAGGRIDYLDGRPAAVLVYRHGKHIINLFLRPSSQPSQAVFLARQGYNIMHWSADGMQYWAVSDAEGNALKRFVRLLRRPPPS